MEKRTSDIIKGIGIILMVLHHVVGFPSWLVVNRYNFSDVWITFMRQSFDVCVPLFCFLSGVGFAYIKKRRILEWGGRL